MFLTTKDGVADFDLELLVELVAVVDRQIEIVEAEAERSPDPDAFGHLDRLEGLAGLGFVACQQYITATYPQLAVARKFEALQSPPMHSGGRSVAEIINASANYWKHHDEWPNPKRPDSEAQTRAVMDSVSPSTDDYPLSSTLFRLALPEAHRFARLVQQLEEWRDLHIARTA